MIGKHKGAAGGVISAVIGLGVLSVCAETVFESVNGFEPHFVPPLHGRLISIKDEPFGAKGDGQTDDTDAFKAAIESNNPRTIYVPAGTYIVRDQLRYGEQDSKKKRTLLIGESQTSTIIRLGDDSPGFDNPAEPKAFIHTRKSSQQGEQNMHMYLYHLTIEIGKNNPGAIALNFHTNNTGAVKDVAIKAVDPVNHPGFRGIAFDDYWFGPGNARYLEVDGFRQGVYIGSAQNHTTLEHVVIRNCSVGLYKSNHTCSARKIATIDCDTAIYNEGRLALIDGSFTGGSGGPAICNEGGLLARRIGSQGYAVAITSDDGPAANGEQVGFYCSQDAVYNWEAAPGLNQGLDLAVEESPELQYPQQADDWAVMPASGDIAAALQEAADQGAENIFLQGGSINTAIEIPASLKRIMGLGVVAIALKTSENPVFRIAENSSDPFILELVYENYGSNSTYAISHESSRTVVFRHGSGGYQSTDGAEGAKVFIESVVGFPFHFTGVNAWVRDLNTEQGGPDHINVLNDNSTLWILGHKTEDWATKIATKNGGFTELLLGAYRQNWDASDFERSGIDPDNTPPLFLVDNAHASLSFGTWASGNQNYKVLVRETRGGDTREIVHSSHGGCCGGGQMLFLGYAEKANHATARHAGLHNQLTAAGIRLVGIDQTHVRLQITEKTVATISVMTPTGRIVTEKEIWMNQAGSYRIPLLQSGKRLAPGLYALSIRQPGNGSLFYQTLVY